MQQPLAYIPSPSQGSVHLGPIPLRGYALMIIIGVVVAVWLGERRWTARGGVSGTVIDIAVWAVPFGLVGGRLYHVITDNQLYFGNGRHPIDALKVWNGGLGIWGAIACGALGAYLGCRRRGISLRTFADAAAPGVALAQAIGRWGNWFNQELYGRPTKLPWAVKIDPAHRPVATPDIGTYHPTFLYESLWCVGVAVLVIWAEKRFRLAYGRTFALYVAAYTVGRAWIEWLRVDPAHHILGLRLNDWTSLIVFLAAVGYLYVYRDRTQIPEGALGTAAEAETGEQTAGDGADQDADGSEPDTAKETAVSEETGASEETSGSEEAAVSEESEGSAEKSGSEGEATDPTADAEPETADDDVPARRESGGAEGGPAPEGGSGGENAGDRTTDAGDEKAEETAGGTAEGPDPRDGAAPAGADAEAADTQEKDAEATDTEQSGDAQAGDEPAETGTEVRDGDGAAAEAETGPGAKAAQTDAAADEEETTPGRSERGTAGARREGADQR